MLNEKQHQILALPIVQEMLKSGDWVIHDGGEKIRNTISNRVQEWLTKAEVSAAPRIIVREDPVDKSDAAIKEWVAAHGPGWCPF